MGAKAPQYNKSVEPRPTYMPPPPPPKKPTPPSIVIIKEGDLAAPKRKYIMDRVELIPGIAFTPTQQRLLDVLGDGKEHKPQELLNAIDAMADANGLAQHMSNLRSKIYASGYLIAAHSAGKAGVSAYQLVQRLQVSME